MHATNWNLASFGALALKNMDRSRQARGQMLDRAGYGPVQTPSTVLHTEPGLNLRRYGEPHGDGPAMLIVPAPIKRSYIWDLSPDVSVVRRCLAQGYQVYLAEWLPVTEEHKDFGLDDYADRLLRACHEAIEVDCGEQQPILAGHSLGGILAAIYSGLHPERVGATILLESPLHFDAPCCFTSLVRSTPDARAIADAFQTVPGVFLNMMSAAASPQAFQWERALDRFASMSSPAAFSRHMQVERWTHDEFPLPGRLFTQIVESLYRNDELMRGTLEVGGREVGPQDLRAPLLCAVDPRSDVIPPHSVLPFHEAAGSIRKKVLHYQGDVGVNLQHVGVLVGESAHKSIWPSIFDWLDGNS